MESPKAVNAFLIGTVVVGLLGAFNFSLYLRDFSVFLVTLGVLFVVFFGYCVAAFFLGITTAPLVWVLSLFGGRKPRDKS